MSATNEQELNINPKTMQFLFEIKFITLLMIFLSAYPKSIQAQTFYVVVGSFSIESGAEEFAASLRNVFMSASFRADHNKEVYHVFVMETTDYYAAEKARGVLINQGFANAWIFSDFERGKKDPNASEPESPLKLELYTGNTVLLSSGDNTILTINRTRGNVRETDEPVQAIPFKFIAKNHNGLLLPGKVSLIKNGGEVAAFKTGEVVTFSGSDHDLTFVCSVAGFRPVIKKIEFNRLGSIQDVFQNEDGAWEVRFGLTKTCHDKITLLYHNIFYPDAVVLQPSSQTALELLAGMMKIDSRIRITIHTHCNPMNTRQIRLPGKENDFFDIDATVSKSGSEKHLTRVRADILRDYLISSGIKGDRISLMGWGSLDMVVKGPEANLELNDRVEVQMSFAE